MQSIVNRGIEFPKPAPEIGLGIACIHAERFSKGGENGTGRISGWITRGAAIVLHGAILTILVFSPTPEPLSGAGGRYLEAIDVEIVASRLIKAHRAEQTIAPDAASEPSAPHEGNQAAYDLATRQRTRRERERPEMSKSEGEPVERAPDKETMPKVQQQDGAASLSIEDSRRTDGPASATPGAIQRYAAQVRGLLARSKPAGRGRRGTVTITFRITESGKLAFARVSGFSGNTVFDEAVVTAVSRASFPPPPAGMTESQLIYVIPFQLK